MPIDFKRYNPRSLEDAVDAISFNLTDEERDIVRTTDPAIHHHSFGQDIRNNWKLWEPNSLLSQHFQNRFKIAHADDMSAIILRALHAKETGAAYDPQEDVKRFAQHWAGFDLTNMQTPLVPTRLSIAKRLLGSIRARFRAISKVK